jgi:hypothetical protein
MSTAPRYRNLREFYPFYLSQHQNSTSRKLHFVGTLMVYATLVHAVVTRNLWTVALAPLWGYGFAWVGHFVFEKNRPATFQYPVLSLISDFVMFGQLLTGKLSFQETRDDSSQGV